MPTEERRRPSARAMALVRTLVQRAYACGASGQIGRDIELTVNRSNEAERDLLAYLADLEAARDFYADPAHYGDTAKRIITADGSFANVCSVLADGGARARAVPQ